MVVIVTIIIVADSAVVFNVQHWAKVYWLFMFKWVMIHLILFLKKYEIILRRYLEYLSE